MSEEAQNLIKRIEKRFCNTATWPRYVELDLIYLDSGGLEPILSEVGLDIIDVWGNDDDAEVRFSTPEAYIENTSCGNIDMSRFAKTAGFFAERVKANQTYNNKKLSIPAAEIGKEISIKGVELGRLVRLIDQFGNKLHRGGTRGDDFKEWSFTVRNKAVYFLGITEYQEYSEKKELVERNENKRRKREEERRKELYGTESSLTQKPSGFRDVLRDIEDLNILLHPALETTSRQLLDNGHCAEAVQRAAQRFEAFLQDIIGDHENYGLPLVGKAFGGDQPLITLNSGETKKDEAEQRGFHFFTRGIISALRNFHSHGHPEDIKRNDAIEYLAMISAVWKRLELANKENDS